MLPEFFGAIGSDRFLDLDELAKPGVGQRLPGHALECWEIYQTCFDGYCESRLDPLFHRLTHPARVEGRIAIGAHEPVLVVGTGPSAIDAMSELARCRRRLRIFTSPRGAGVLARHRLDADLVLVEHRTALDAHHTARALRDGGESAAITSASYVAADWRTPSPILQGVASDRLFVPDPLPSWGVWPATAVALALQAGAARIGLLGIDLGTNERPDPTFAPTQRVLSHLAAIGDARTWDCGRLGARKTGWTPGPLDALASAHDLHPTEVIRRPAPSQADRRASAQSAIERTSAHVARARDMLNVAVRARAGHGHGRLAEMIAEILGWRADRDLRVLLQECLGLSFLPRLWRSGVDLGMGPALWRPLALATHEMVGQADRLRECVTREAA